MIPGSPYGKIWTNGQCTNLGTHYVNLEDCQKACMKKLSCTAIDFGPNHCILMACPRPIPDPSKKYKDFKGYIIKPGTTGYS